MSRLAKKPIKIPEGVVVKQDDGFLRVSGPRGELKTALFPGVTVELENDDAWVRFNAQRKKDKAILGTNWSLVRNAIHGAKEGFSKILDIEGVGYRAALEDKHLILHLGYANPVKFKIPEGIKAEVEKNTIKIFGIDKALVGQVAADIRSFKKPEPYKGKGIRYRGEVIRRKAGKKAGAAAA